MVETEVPAALPLFAPLDEAQLQQIAPWFEQQAQPEIAAAIEEIDRKRHTPAG
jgi:hypothetical protein